MDRHIQHGLGLELGMSRRQAKKVFKIGRDAVRFLREEIWVPRLLSPPGWGAALGGGFFFF